MKFWAILKDSFREAVDCKVMYVTVGLACLVLLAVASVSYEPMPAEATLRNLVSGNLAWQMAGVRGQPPPDDGPPLRGSYQLQSVRVLSGAADSPDSEYLLVVQRLLTDEEAARKARANPEPEIEKLKMQLAPLESPLMEITGARLLPAAPGAGPQVEHSLLFELQARPTAALRRIWSHKLVIGFGAAPLHDFTQPLGLLLYGLASLVIFTGSWVTILIGVIITAFFIPNMLRKGTIDLLLAKPISRGLLLSYKYLGGLLFIFLNTSFTIVGIWLILGLRSGVWANSFLLMIFIMTFFFAILYAVSTLLAVLTQSAVVAILGTCAAWFFFFLVGLGNQLFLMQKAHEERRKTPVAERTSAGAFAQVVYAVHFVTPRTRDLDLLANQILLNDFMAGDVARFPGAETASISWGASLAASLTFIAIMLGLACWRFAVKDY